MIIKQLSVFLEDKPGRLTDLTKILSDNDINITALSIADAADYGIARMIVGRPDLAVDVLKKHNFSVNITNVVGVVIPNKPGGLYHILKILSENNITVDYLYAFALGNASTAVIRAASNEEVIKILKENQMELLKTSDIYQI